MPAVTSLPPVPLSQAGASIEGAHDSLGISSGRITEDVHISRTATYSTASRPEQVALTVSGPTPLPGTLGMRAKRARPPPASMFRSSGHDEHLVHDFIERASGVDEEGAELPVAPRFTPIPTYGGGQLLRMLSELVGRPRR